MVRFQLLPRGIEDPRVIKAFETVARHAFVPKDLEPSAYEDCALPIGNDQTISQPYIVARMTELLELTGKETVLEIGTGSGYQAAILSQLCNKVHTVEQVPELSARAQKTCDTLGYKNIAFHTGDGSLGWPDSAPYDAILVTAAAPDTPPPLLDQLKDNGRLVIPLGERRLQIMTRIRKNNGIFRTDRGEACVFVPLLGKYGWQ